MRGKGLGVNLTYREKSFEVFQDRYEYGILSKLVLRPVKIEKANRSFASSCVDPLLLVFSAGSELIMGTKMTVKLVQNFLEDYDRGIVEIKLRDLLQLKEKVSIDPRIRTLFPPIEIGSITLVDQIVILCLLKILKPSVILEIGTYLGYTTSLLAINTSVTKIISIDLPHDHKSRRLNIDKSQILVNPEVNDNFLRQKQADEGEKYLKYLEDYDREKIKLIKCDSTELDFPNDIGTIDFAFIDGGHTEDIIKSDTEGVFSCMKKGVIVWHDYKSGIHSGVTKFLQKQSSLKIFHVKNSLCAFSIIGF